MSSEADNHPTGMQGKWVMGIAEILGIPAVTLARKVEISGGTAKVERVIPDGYQVIEVTLPAVIVVTSGIGALRYATLKGIMADSQEATSRLETS